MGIIISCAILWLLDLATMSFYSALACDYNILMQCGSLKEHSIVELMQQKNKLI